MNPVNFVQSKTNDLSWKKILSCDLPSRSERDQTSLLPRLPSTVLREIINFLIETERPRRDHAVSLMNSCYHVYLKTREFYTCRLVTYLDNMPGYYIDTSNHAPYDPHHAFSLAVELFDNHVADVAFVFKDSPISPPSSPVQKMDHYLLSPKWDFQHPFKLTFVQLSFHESSSKFRNQSLVWDIKPPLTPLCPHREIKESPQPETISETDEGSGLTVNSVSTQPKPSTPTPSTPLPTRIPTTPTPSSRPLPKSSTISSTLPSSSPLVSPVSITGVSIYQTHKKLSPVEKTKYVSHRNDIIEGKVALSIRQIPKPSFPPQQPYARCGIADAGSDVSLIDQPFEKDCCGGVVHDLMDSFIASYGFDLSECAKKEIENTVSKACMMPPGMTDSELVEMIAYLVLQNK